MRQTGPGDLLTKCWADAELPEVTEKRTFNQPLSAVAETHTQTGRNEKGATRTAGGRSDIHNMFKIQLL